MGDEIARFVGYNGRSESRHADDPRRTDKDLPVVVELIVVKNLDRSFARFLHKSLRKACRDMVKRARSK